MLKNRDRVSLGLVLIPLIGLGVWGVRSMTWWILYGLRNGWDYDWTPIIADALLLLAWPASWFVYRVIRSSKRSSITPLSPEEAQDEQSGEAGS